MNILVLTKAVHCLRGIKFKDTEDYLLSHPPFEGWCRGFKDGGHKVVLDGRSYFFIPIFIAYRFPKLYWFLNGFFHRSGLILIDRIFLSKSIERKVARERIKFVFTELNDSLTVSSIERMKKVGVKVTEWFGVFPEMAPPGHLKTLNHFSHIWCPGDITNELRSQGVTKPNIHYISCSYNKKLLYNDFDQNYAFDVCFVGGISKSHSDRVEVLEEVARNFDGFAFYGYGIENLESGSILRERFKGWADVPTMRKLFSSSKIALNLILNDYDRVKRGINSRCFDIPACRGALQLCVYNKNIKEFFDDDEIAYFRNTNELILKIKNYLANNRERKSIVDRAFEKNKGNNYGNRANRMLEIIEEDIRQSH